VGPPRLPSPAPAAESSLSKIIRLIHEAQESKAPAQRFTDKFGSAYTYFILGVSIVMFFVWWKIWPAYTPDPSAARNAFYRTMTLLVVASPCALVLSIPSADAGRHRSGGAARHFVPGRRGARKAGRNPSGSPSTRRAPSPPAMLQVRSVQSVPAGREDQLLARAAALANNSTHPVSQAVRAHRARTQAGAACAATDFRSLTGSGVQATVAGRAAQLGRRSLIGPAAWLDAHPGARARHHRGSLCGWRGARTPVLLEDQVRPSSRPLLAKLMTRVSISPC
jgi:Cd2+/Zn2+-exporting ATPase